jgi:hypothetical protein
MAEGTQDLKGIQGILWPARMDAAAQRWHLGKRAVPALKALADESGEPRLHQAVERTAKAGEHFDAARDALHGAIRLIEACAPAPVREAEPD